MDSQEYQRRKREELDLLVCDAVDGRLEIKAQYQHGGCPYCHSTDSLPYSNEDLSKGLSYVRCRICRLVYPLPRLGQDALDTRVDSPILNEYYRGSVQGLREEEDITRARAEFRQELGFLGEHCDLGRTTGIRVLEVGCADGRFLKTLAAIVGKSRNFAFIARKAQR